MARFAEVCAVSVHRVNLKSEEGTCSGIVIDSRQGLVLTHASVLVPLLSKSQHLLHTMKKHWYYTNKVELSKLAANIYLQRRTELTSNISHNGQSQSRFQPSLLNCKLQNTDSHISYDKCPADVLAVFRIDSLKKILSKLVPSDTWHFQEDMGSDGNSERNVEEDDKFFLLLPCFVLLQLQDWDGYDSVLSLRASVDNRLGDSVEICATPFGGLNPEVFLNSQSRGIVSNLAGERQVLVLTDARCIPGSEGGAVYYTDGSNRYLTGVLIACLCWKNNEWVGLSLACAISEVLECMTRFYDKAPEFPVSNLPSVRPFPSKFLSSLALWRVPLVSVGGMWGSGIIICPERGLILTCSHVIKGCERSPVNVIIQPKCVLPPAEVLYRTPQDGQFDVALLLVPPASLPHGCFVPKIAQMSEGDQAYVIGHAIFGHDHGLEPTITSGIVSKVISIGHTPVMVQTSCAVHPGASGGPVINGQGELVGMVVCNSKDTGTGACYPHINMSVPMTTIAPVLKEYLKSGDPDVLDELHIHNKAIQRLWSLGNAQPANNLYAKL